MDTMTYEQRRQIEIEQAIARDVVFRERMAAVLAELRRLEPSIDWRKLPPTQIDIEDNRAPHQQHYVIAGGTDEQIGVSHDSYGRRDRIAFSVYWPTMPDGSTWSPRLSVDGSSPEITVAFDKDAKAIARAVVGRLLPAYRELLAKAQAQRDGSQKYIDTTQATIARLVSVSGGWLRQRTRGQYDRKPSDQIDVAHDRHGVSYGTINVSGDSVRLELSMTAGAAEKLIACLVKTAK